MAKVKPYIITIKYIATYADPAPTEEQILAELNVDALEVSIEEALVTKSPKGGVAVDLITPAAPIEEIDVETPAVSAPAPRKIAKDDNLGINTKHLDRSGPSLAVLKTLKSNGPQSLTQIREATKWKGASLQVSVSRLKAQGRIKVVGVEKGTTRFIYEFVR